MSPVQERFLLQIRSESRAGEAGVSSVVLLLQLSLSLSLFLRLSVSPSIIHPYASFGYLERVSPAGSIHPSHVSSAVVPSGSCVHRHDAWLKGSQQCSSSCQTQRGRRLKNSCPSWSAPLRNGFTVAVGEKLDFVKSLAEP